MKMIITIALVLGLCSLCGVKVQVGAFGKSVASVQLPRPW